MSILMTISILSIYYFSTSIAIKTKLSFFQLDKGCEEAKIESPIITEDNNDDEEEEEEEEKEDNPSSPHHHLPPQLQPQSQLQSLPQSKPQVEQQQQESDAVDSILEEEHTMFVLN
ncbi:hypothetical protein PS15p_202072 [Mucor circinelloides]